ncbi:MAG: GIY-YIG nuclease family protein [Patescibacteria group bacterium]
MFYVYAIKSIKRNYIYVGLTNNLARRFAEHNNKKERTTRVFAPFRILLAKRFTTRIKARQKEKYFKSGVGKEYLKTL